MTENSWRARIDREDGQKVLGAGLLAAPGLVLTCAHVVNGHTRVMVTFPAADGGGIRAEVQLPGPWEPGGEPAKQWGDIAVLKLAETPRDILPCEFADLDALKPRDGQDAFRLRALGFAAAGGDREGDYVTVEGSADQSMGRDNEWLQVDVVKAHAQLIAEGFSGAGLYLPETGKVAGMLKAVLPASERGGYIGRMLPLAAIRKYWPELDDYLPHPWWPEPLDFRLELREIAGAAGMSWQDVRSAFEQSFPHFEHGSFPRGLSLWEAVNYVRKSVPSFAESGRPADTLGQFLIGVSPFLEGSSRASLAAWARRWEMADLAAAIASARHAVVSIAVRVTILTKGNAPHRHGGQGKEGDYVEVDVRRFVGGGDTSAAWVGELCSGTAGLAEELVQAAAEPLIGKQVDALGPRGPEGSAPLFEFAVDMDYVTAAFDEWAYPALGLSRRRPLRSETLIVYDERRLEPAASRARDLVADRWQALRSGGLAEGTTLRQVECHAEDDYDDVYDDLDMNRDLAVLAYGGSPGGDWLEASIDVGMPVMAWCREQCLVGGDGHASHVSELLTALKDALPDQFPGTVAELRRRARGAAAGAGPLIGRHLSFYFDNPARLPYASIRGLE